MRVFYGRSQIGSAEAGPNRLALRLGATFSVRVETDAGTAVVPLVLAEPALFVPRGTRLALSLEEFCAMLGGSFTIDEDDAPDEFGDANDPQAVPSTKQHGRAVRTRAIPWRVILRAVRSIERELARDARFPRAVEHILGNELWLRGLRRRLALEHEQRAMTDADLAFALHEIWSMLVRAATDLGECRESAEMVAASAREVDGDLSIVSRGLSRTVRRQIAVMKREVTS
jgi:hypothetical protein